MRALLCISLCLAGCYGSPLRDFLGDAGVNLVDSSPSGDLAGTCPQGAVFCGGACFTYDYNTDPDNCGGCARRCPAGNVCASGQCTSIHVLSPMGGCGLVTTPLGFLMESGPGNVYLVAFDGSATTPLTTGTSMSGCGSLASDGVYAYWTRPDPHQGHPVQGTVNRVPLAGGPTEVLATEVDPSSLNIESGTVYWLNGAIAKQFPNAIVQIPASGGAVSQIAAPQSPGTLLVRDATAWVSNTHLTAMAATYMPVATGSSHYVDGLLGTPILAAVDASTLYYAAIVSNDYELWSIPRLGGTPMKLAPISTGLSALTLDGTNIYFADASDSGVFKIATTGGAKIPIAPNQTSVRGIAVHDSSVCWTTNKELRCAAR